MRTIGCVSLCLLLCLASTALTRPADKSAETSSPAIHIESRLTDQPPDMRGLFSTAQADTYVLAEYEFDAGGLCIDEGWYYVDMTAQQGLWWHVDNYRVISGSQSMWCGARPSTNQEPECTYSALPGYGNLWDQSFTSTYFSVSGNVTFSFNFRYDSESSYDYTYIEYRDAGDTVWTNLFTFDGVGDSLCSAVISSAEHGGSVKFRYRFQSDGAWSDEDGLWDTQGAAIVDNILVIDGSGLVDSQDFESETIGSPSTSDGDWVATPALGYGDFSSLFPGVGVLQDEDECARDYSCLWGFFSGSTDNYSCGGHPEQFVVPFENEQGQFISNYVWSPWFEYNPGGIVPSTASVARFEFWVYRDLPLDNLIFYHWLLRSKGASGCPFSWQDRDFVYYGQDGWIRGGGNVGDLIGMGATHIQLGLGVNDMCKYWCGIYGTGACHSNSPLFDHVKFYRVDNPGPVFNVRDIELFQDNFPENGTTTGTVRMDMAYDRMPASSPSIYPGDSAVFRVSGSNVGIGVEPHLSTGKAAVYAYAKVTPLTHNTGAPMSDDLSRWQYVGPAGSGWHQFLCDTVYSRPGAPVPDKFCFDFNDSYFTPPDRIDFYFGATDANGFTTYWSGLVGTTSTEQDVRDNPEEIQCLPTGESDILYVDDFSGRGAQPYFDSVFDEMGLTPDRYDVRGPSSLVANGLGARAGASQIVDIYHKIFWNSGNLSAGTIGDGTGIPEKSPDAQLLYTFLDQSSIWNPGLYMSGDDIAEEMKALSSTPILNLLTFMGYNLIDGSHAVANSSTPWGGMTRVSTGAGHKVSPAVYGSAPTTIFQHPQPPPPDTGPAGAYSSTALSGPDTLIAYGGCPLVNDFDVMQPTGTSRIEMYYEGDPTHGAILLQVTANAYSKKARVLLSGFSYHYIRDDRPHFPYDRVDHLIHIIRAFENIVDDPTDIDDTLSYRNSLEQNYPNPFNPETTIKFTLKERAHVSLKIYNIAGQLVRTLVNERRDMGVYTDVGWNGFNDRGEPVSSGVYFYQLISKEFTQTRKMVLLK